MRVFDLPGEGPLYRLTVAEDGFRSNVGQRARPVYRWTVTDGDDRLVSMGSMQLAGEPGGDHDFEDAAKRLAARLSADGEALEEESSGAPCAPLYLESERVFLVETWRRWLLVNNPQEQVVSG